MNQGMKLNAAYAAAGITPQGQAVPWYREAAFAVRKSGQGLSVAVLGAALVATSGVLNGGTVPPTSAFSPLKTWLQTSFLGSDWVIMIGLVALIALVWGLAHGKGWGPASIVLGVISVPIIGPNAISALATATREPVPVVQKVEQAAPTVAGVSANGEVLQLTYKPSSKRVGV